MMFRCPGSLVAAGLLAAAATCRGAGQDSTVLQMAKQWTDPAKDCGGTIWRYHETWQTDVVRTDAGALVHVESGVWRKKTAGGNDRTGPFELASAKKVVGSDFPASGWEQPDFDDSEWTRNPGPFDSYYRSLAMIAVRGKFQVSNPDSDMDLMVSFQGGAVAYLNGKEIGREGLPSGKIADDTLANDYPKETDDGGSSRMTSGLIVQGAGLGDVFRKDEAEKLWGVNANDKAAVAEHYRQRFRALQVKIPASALRKGVNVLAIEVHRAPAHSVMFLAPYSIGDSMYKFCWNRCMVEDIRLTARSAAGIVPNVSRPTGVQVWNSSPLSKLLPSYYGDPNENVHPVHLVGARNGVYSAQIVVSSPSAIKGVSAEITDLKSREGQIIPASSAIIGYQSFDVLMFNPDFGQGISSSRVGFFNTLDTQTPKDVAVGTRSAKIGAWTLPSYPVAMQPIWISVRVPKTAKVGEYAGKIMVMADGKTTEVPLQVKVAGEWTLPDPQKFKTFIGMVESPDSVALKYNVKMWSEEHWKLLDKAFALMAEVGVKDLYIPLLAKSNLGNEESMVKWVRQSDGSVKPDFGIVERYLDTATRHLGKQLCVVCWVHELPFSRGGSSRTWAGKAIAINRGDPAALAGGFPIPYTQVDASGKATEQEAPQWGTPESKAFWKPVVDGMKNLLVKRGMEKTLVFGCATDGAFIPQCKSDFQTLAPDVHWYSRAHHVFNIKDLSYFNWGCLPAAGSDVMTVNWSPDMDDAGGEYRWRSPAWKTSIPIVTGAWSMNMLAEPAMFRVAAESILVHKDRSTAEITFGLGCQGTDYWSVLKAANGDDLYTLNRYTDQCGNMDQFSATYAFLGAGKEAPAATAHLRLLQESLQDMEARIFVQDAVLDQKEKLGADLARRCAEVCDDRTRQLFYYSQNLQYKESYRMAFPHEAFNAAWYQQNTAQLYALAGEVARALGQ